MTDLKKLAEEYGRDFGESCGLAYQVGARAAIRAASAKVKADAGTIMQNYVLTGPAGIVGGCVQSIRSLLPEVST